MSDTQHPCSSAGPRPERPAPVKTTGFVGFLRTRLFNSPTNILITIVSALLLWFTVVPALKFLLVDAVWTGKDRTACLPKMPGTWSAPAGRSSRRNSPVHLRILSGAGALAGQSGLLSRRDPAAAAADSAAAGQGPQRRLFFLAFPVVAFFLLHGGGSAASA
jgi:general L-amino acid transport system permease protein